jgi:dolichol-phosphate mannosyltransferase
LGGYLKFCAVCSLGLLANVAVAQLVIGAYGDWWMAVLAGAATGAVWNYVTSTIAVW